VGLQLGDGNPSALIRDLKLNPGQHFGLVMSEDKDYLNGEPPHDLVPPNTHSLSTRAFFVALAQLGVIASAEDLRTTVQNNGRPNLSKSLIDKPFVTPEFRTDYRESIKAVRDRQQAERAQKRRDRDEPGGGFKP
jgi:hypothetical protein